MADLQHFGQQLAEMGLIQSDAAVALLWYRDHKHQGVEATARELGTEMHTLGISDRVNNSRLAKQLGLHKDTVRGNGAGTFRIKAASRSSLDAKYSRFTGKRPPKPSDSIIPKDWFDGRRKPWRDLVAQINGCYDYHFYDGAAVLCRRLVESLIVELFKAKKIDSKIKTTGGDYMMLDGLIKVLKQSPDVRISKSAKPALEPIQRIGNTAAHSSHHITTKQDADDMARNARPLVSELLGLIDEANK